MFQDIVILLIKIDLIIKAQLRSLSLLLTYIFFPFWVKYWIQRISQENIISDYGINVCSYFLLLKAKLFSFKMASYILIFILDFCNQYCCTVVYIFIKNIANFVIEHHWKNHLATWGLEPASPVSINREGNIAIYIIIIGLFKLCVLKFQDKGKKIRWNELIVDLLFHFYAHFICEWILVSISIKPCKCAII